MPLTCASMALEVQNLCARTGDTVLITAGQLTVWMNEAQQDIVDRVPGLHAVTFKNTASLDTTAKSAYAIADITAGDYTSQPVASIWNVWFLDGQNSTRLHFVHTDEYDANWPDPTHEDAPFGRPTHWTRRGGNIEIRPVCSSGYYDYHLRVDGEFYPRDFTSGDATAYSDLSKADEGLKLYALKEAWRSIGNPVKALDYSQRYEGWRDGYEHRNDRLNEWQGSLYGDDIE
jgi:hypothetical protein